ncbi:hypothetical protein EZV62_023078 [Acer yangbiense]|uniref:Uncharacterized protein n=1 Tax=Acer yangbiense TaxID=1000413 RepID=A0A5C7H0P5_9ROSI|nr:hypothetical protein EZV62_023078 [Acer yangbiense]
MASAINFSGQALRQNMCFRATGGKSLCSLPAKRSCQLKQNQMKIQQNWPMQGQAKNKPFVEHRRYLVVSAINQIDVESSPFSASDMIRQFYACINEKNLKKLDNYISNDCYIEDCSFPNPFQGKKEPKYKIFSGGYAVLQTTYDKHGSECEVQHRTCLRRGQIHSWGKLALRMETDTDSFHQRMQLLRMLNRRRKTKDKVESSGCDRVTNQTRRHSAGIQTLLKNLTSLFDDFPKATEWFLKSPNVILQVCLNIYMKLLAPFISPLLAGYIRIANFMARILALALNILYQILKIIFK